MIHTRAIKKCFTRWQHYFDRSQTVAPLREACVWYIQTTSCRLAVFIDDSGGGQQTGDNFTIVKSVTDVTGMIVVRIMALCLRKYEIPQLFQ